MNWRRLFPIIFLFSCFEGFISNYFYPAKLPFLLKDIFILIVYILFFITREPGKRWIFEFKNSIGGGSWYLAMLLILLGVLQIFNPEVPNALVAILGFKIMFFYWPLAILAYAYIDSLDTLERFIKTFAYLSIPICIFSIYQFWRGPNFMVDTFGPGFKRAIMTSGGGIYGGEEFIRVIGTFASTGQFVVYLIITYTLILGLLFTTRNKLEKLIMIACLVLNYITMLCTGSRGGVLLLFGTSLIFVILCRWLWRTFFIVLLLAISFNFGFAYLGKGVLGRIRTVRDTEMIRGRTIETVSGMFNMYLEKHPFGRGMGTASLPARHLYTEFPTDIEMIENYPTKLLCEVGIAGVILFYTLLLSLFIHWLKHWLKFIDRRHYIFVAALTTYCWAYFFCSIFSLIDSPPVGLFLWAEVGMVIKLATLHSDDQYPLST